MGRGHVALSILPLYLPLSLSLSRFQPKFVLFFSHFTYLVSLFQGQQRDCEQQKKKHFASIALPELILSLSDMLTDFTNKIEHSFSVNVLTCMWPAKCLQMVNHSVFQQELLTNHSAPDGSKSSGGSWSVAPRRITPPVSLDSLIWWNMGLILLAVDQLVVGEWLPIIPPDVTFP